MHICIKVLVTIELFSHIVTHIALLSHIVTYIVLTLKKSYCTTLTYYNLLWERIYYNTILLQYNGIL